MIVIVIMIVIIVLIRHSASQTEFTKIFYTAEAKEMYKSMIKFK